MAEKQFSEARSKFYVLWNKTRSAGHRIACLFFPYYLPTSCIKTFLLWQRLQLLAGSKKTSKGREMLVFDLNRSIRLVCTKPLAEFGGLHGFILVPSFVCAFHLLGTHWGTLGLNFLIGLRILAGRPGNYRSAEVIYCFPGKGLKDSCLSVLFTSPAGNWNPAHCQRDLLLQGIREKPEGTE